MSISIGDQVALVNPVANSLPEKRSGNFVLGVAVVDGGTLITVQWENGEQSQVEEAFLDLIIPIANVDFAGRVVVVTDWPSPEYRMLVLQTYDRRLNGTGTITAYALCQLLSTGARLEVPYSLLELAPGSQ